MTSASPSGARSGVDVPRSVADVDALVDEASMESFPAKDPPSYWGRSANGTYIDPMTVTGENPRREGDDMADADVMESIEKLAHEEHELREREGRGEISNEDRERLRTIELRLDQCWDFLRQRRARLAAGLDPDEAKVRDVDTVENYRS
jgi:Protein of unknown function (DUF2630)